MNNIDEIIKSFNKLCGKYDAWTVFEDFLYLSAASLANNAYFVQEKEDKYLEIANKYTPEEVTILAELLAQVAMTLFQKPDDVLGSVFMRLNLNNHYKGQFFTPYHVSKLMAEMSLNDADEVIKQKGFITCCEPCCGAGGMAIAFADVIKSKGHDVRKEVCIDAIDIDFKCVLMTYIQLSILGVPARVIHGNSLSQETWDVWYTPAYIGYGWNDKFKNNISENKDNVV